MTLDRICSWSSTDPLQLDDGNQPNVRERPLSPAPSRPLPPTSATTESSAPQPPRYGWRSWTPGWLQQLNNPKAFLAFMCWFVFVQSFPVNGLLNVNTTTLQRRFRLTSTDLGLLSAIYDIVGGLVVVPIGYYGGRGHKPHYLAVGSLFIVIGSLTMLAPHLFAGYYRYDSQSSHFNSECSADIPAGVLQLATCSSTEASASDGGSAINVQNYLYVLLVGQGLLGYGGLVLYTLCPVFIDENVSRRLSPLYMGIFYAAASLAAAVGFLAGSRFLTLYVDTPQVPTPESLTQDDPQWVGAWWLGYAVNVGLAAPLAVFVFGIPRVLPGAEKVKVGRTCEAHDGSAEEPGAAADGVGGVRMTPADPASLPKATGVLLRNPVFVCLTASGICDSLFKSGVSQFLSQYIQNQFNQTSSWAAMLSGFVLVPGAIGGSVIGGWLPKKYDLRMRGLLSLCVASSAFILLISVGFLMNCPAPLANFESGGGAAAAFNLTHSCNALCDCGTDTYEPVCGSDGLQYFSACHAGCGRSTSASNGTVKFSDCACVIAGNVSADAETATEPVSGLLSSSGRTAVEGKCEVQCPFLPVFMVLIFLGILAAFIKLSPWTAATMRVVKDDKRAVAIGLQAVFIRLMGIAPGPVAFGAIIDSTCLVWQQERCSPAADGRGSCWLYESDSLSRRLVTCLVVLKTASLVFDSLSLLLYRAPRASVTASAAENEKRHHFRADDDAASVGDGRGGACDDRDDVRAEGGADDSAPESPRAVEYVLTYDDRGLAGDSAYALSCSELSREEHQQDDGRRRDCPV